MSDRARVLAFIRAIDERASTRVERFSSGTAYFCPELPTVWVRNFVWVEAQIDESDLPRLVRDTDELHAQAGLRHRRLVFADEDSGSRAAALLGPSGWRVQADRVMVFRGAVERLPDSPEVREVDAAALRPASEAAYLEHPEVPDSETVEHLLTADALLGRVTGERCFAWLVDDRVASCCRLFSDGETAQVESVTTLPEFRGRGYSHAVVSKALRAAADSHGMTFLVAAEDDWPRHWYARLGFEDAGRLPEVLRTSS